MTEVRWNQRITQARSKLGMTKTEFWRALKVSSATATNWENGKVESIKGPNLVNVCRVLGVSEEWLLFGKDDNLESNQRLSSESKQVLEMMEKFDQRGREKILSAVQDAYELHTAYLKKLQSYA